jgi:hypothetical protein
MVLKALLATLAVLAAAAIAGRAAPGGDGGRAQAVGLELDPVLLSSAERSAILEGKVVLRAVDNPGLKGRTYEAIGVLPGTLEDVLGVLLDFRHYDEFMPRVERTVVTDEGPMVSLVEQYLKLPMGTHRRCRLRYTARLGTEGFRVEWAQVPWPEVPASHAIAETSGHWQVAPDACGELLAVYHVYTDPGHVPLGLKGLALSISKRDLPKVLEAVRDRLRPPAARVPLEERPPRRPQTSAP